MARFLKYFHYDMERDRTTLAHVHRDIKLENILASNIRDVENMIVAVADLG